MKKRYRVLKKNRGRRDFKCGCGKEYLTNAALWTHQKNKHDKQIPDGSSN